MRVKAYVDPALFEPELYSRRRVASVTVWVPCLNDQFTLPPYGTVTVAGV